MVHDRGGRGRARRQPPSPALADAAAALVQHLVAAGAALGWVDPPPAVEVHDLLADVAAHVDRGDAALALATTRGGLVGFGYWRRYSRPTHRPHADVEKLAVAEQHQGRGAGRAILNELIAAAREANVEVLTLDLRADNVRAIALYESLGFRRYGTLEAFVAVGPARYDKLFYSLDLRTHGSVSVVGSSHETRRHKHRQSQAQRMLADFLLDDDPTHVDLEVIWSFLSAQAYWGRWRGRAEVEAQVREAWRVVGIYQKDDGTMVGFARAVSDGIALAYLADVFVVPQHRGRGLGRALITAMIDGGPGAGFRWLLHTADAHGLYADFGFAPPDATLLERPGTKLGRHDDGANKQ